MKHADGNTAAEKFLVVYSLLCECDDDSHLSGLAGAATFESSTFECRDLALADQSAQPSCWNMGSYDETWLPSLACRSYHRFTARLRSAGEAEITADSITT